MEQQQGDQGRFVLAIVLMLGVLMLWSWVMRSRRPPTPPPGEDRAIEDTRPAPVPPADTPGPLASEMDDAFEPEGDLGVPTAVDDIVNDAPRAIVLENDLYRVTLHEQGAQVRSWLLRDYPRLDERGRVAVDEATGRPLSVELVSLAADRFWSGDAGGTPSAYPGYPLAVFLADEEATRRLNRAGFDCGDGPAEGTDAGGRRTVSVTCRYRSAEEGLSIEKSLVLTEGSHFVDLVFRVRDASGVPLEGARVLWGPGMSRPTASQQKDRYYFSGRAVAAIPGGDIARIDRNKVEQIRDVAPAAGLEYAGLEEKYFAAIFLPEGADRRASPLRDGVEILPFEEVSFDDEGKEIRQKRLAVTVAVDGPETGYRLFVGPKDSRLLAEIDAAAGTGLSRLVDWGFFWFLSRPLYWALVTLHGILGNYGIAIILITIFIKICFFPVTQKAMVNMRKTQEKMSTVQPKMKAIREKYRKKKDPEARKKMNQEMMALYQKEGVNPMGGLAGCLPLLLQLPILWGMYTVLSGALELRGAPFFLWIRDLSVADPFYVTPLLMGITMFTQQFMAMTKAKDPQQKQQQRMMLFMPLMFTWFFLWLPSGLVLYWLVNNVLGIGQQWLINKQAAAPAAAS